MNPPIVRLYAFFALLFGVLVFATSWWAVFTAPKLRDNANNRRPLLAEERIKRGTIRSADGKVMARSVKIDKERYRRTYPTKDMFAQAIGYSYTTLGRSGLEQFRNDPLTGRRTELIGAIDSLLNKRGEGDSVRTTLNTKAQQAAITGLAGRKGAVVALEPSTGKVLVMVSSPSYDPNNLDKGDKFKRLSADDANSPLVNRTTQAGYPPGSTMKTVTATAAIDSGKYTPDSTVSGKNGKKISGVPLNNFGGEDFGNITLTDALTNSVNTVWAEVGEKLGRNTMADYMLRYGFYKQPPIDLPSDQLLASGERGPNGKLLRPRSPRIDVGRMAIGQDKLLVTPLQMATVAATIANGGVRMEPRLTDKIVDPDGRTQDQIKPKVAERVMSADTARALTAMMKQVVKEGTGTAAALQGVELAGKTGTAEIDIARRINDPWFIGFTNDFAVAVVLERVQGGTGGVVAAPIAKQVLEALGGK
jgi:peptidoglycan glycosyltransferase